MTARVKPKLFRDPVHDTIVVARDRLAGGLVLRLLDTPELQRLRRIRQLGLSFLVYPGAEHSRFTHSMGVMWLAHTMMDRLAHQTAIPDDAAAVTLASCLLHDVGHGPFSHALESVTGIRHEVFTAGIITDPDSGVHRVLADVDPTLPARVAANIDGTGDGPAFLSDIVSSQLDADRLDYILRDGHATGVRIGNYDLARILALLEVSDGHLAVNAGAQEAVEGYLLARFHMYKQVYLHKTGRTAERMLEAALRRAGHLRRDGHRFGYWPEGPLGDLIMGEALSPGAFCELDDIDVWLAMKRWSRETDRTLRDLATGLVQRRLFKPLIMDGIDEARAAELVSAARSVARVRGYDPETSVLVDLSRDTLYRPFTGVDSQQRSIRLVDGSGHTAFIEDRSDVVKMLAGLHLRQRMLCVHPDLRDAIQRLLGPAQVT